MIALSFFSSCALVSFHQTRGAQDRTDSLDREIRECQLLLEDTQVSLQRLRLDSASNTQKMVLLQAKMQGMQSEIHEFKTVDAPSQLNLLMNDIEERDSVIHTFSDLREKRDEVLRKLYINIQHVVRKSDDITCVLSTDRLQIIFANHVLVLVDSLGNLQLNSKILPLVVRIADYIRREPVFSSEVIAYDSRDTYQHLAPYSALVTDFLVDKAIVPAMSIQSLAMRSPLLDTTGKHIKAQIVWNVYAHRADIEEILFR